jgi:hypothetical protein
LKPEPTPSWRLTEGTKGRRNRTTPRAVCKECSRTSSTRPAHDQPRG